MVKTLSELRETPAGRLDPLATFRVINVVSASDDDAQRWQGHGLIVATIGRTTARDKLHRRWIALQS